MTPARGNRRGFFVAILLLLGVGVATSCTPEQMAFFDSLTPEQKEIIRSMHQKPVDCYTAIDRVWPPGLRAKAKTIVKRESGNNPRAQNRRSSAAGCFQMLKLHAPTFSRLGYSWGTHRYDAVANTRVAYALYQGSGWRPWRLTAY